MWFLIPIAGAAVVAILALASDWERDARATWEAKHQAAQRTVEEHRRNIERQLSAAQASYDFNLLNHVYHSSFRVADHAYGLLEAAKASLGGLKRMIAGTRAKRAALKQQFVNGMPKSARQALITELSELRELQFALQKDFDTVLTQKRSLAEEVTRFNQQTMHLKESIRDKCGQRGREWYMRAQERAQARRSGA